MSKIGIPEEKDGLPHTAAGQAALRKRLVGAARKLTPLLRANAAQAEAERRIPQANIDAMHEAGLFRLRSPSVFGGYEADCLTYFDVVAELGRGCGSTGWVAFISNGAAWGVCALSEKARREIFAPNPDARFIGLLTPTATAEPAEGGVRISGRWGYASGCLHADWAQLAAPLPDGSGGKVPGMVVMPMAELEIEDTWYFAGCAGTGSNTVIASNVFVPGHRTLPLSVRLSGNALGPAEYPPAYREAFAATAVIMCAAPVLGMAEAAFDFTLDRINAGGKRIAYSNYQDLRESPAMQIKMAEARSLIDVARASMRGWCDRIASAARASEEISFTERARLRVDVGTAMQACRDAVDRLLSIQGASAFANDNPMQRVWRDIEFASRHGALTPEVPLEILGRDLFGNSKPLSDLV